MTTEPPQVFGVLVVCTANICRSPAAEVLLRRAVGGHGDVRVTSAGLMARAGTPLDGEIRRLIPESPEGSGARPLTAALVEDADLVLTMTRAQRADVVSRYPAAVRRTFTLQEFAGLAALAGREGPALPPGRGAGLAALKALAPRLRAHRPSGPADDVDDPYGQHPRAYEAAVAEIDQAVRTIDAALSTPITAR